MVCNGCYGKGHWLAYLFDSTRPIDIVWDTPKYARITNKRWIKFKIAYKMLMEMYDKSDRVLLKKVENSLVFPPIM